MGMRALVCAAAISVAALCFSGEALAHHPSGGGGGGGHSFSGGSGGGHSFGGGGGSRSFGSSGGGHSFGSGGGHSFGSSGHSFGSSGRSFGGGGRSFGSGHHSFGGGGRSFGSSHGFSGHRSFGGGRGFGDHHGFGGARRLAGHGHYFYHGHNFERFHAGYYRWPHGYHYVHYRIGGYLPRYYWSPDYYITDYADYDLDVPPPGFVWMRYGPDLVLFDENSGQIAQEIPGAFYESDDDGGDQ